MIWALLSISRTLYRQKDQNFVFLSTLAFWRRRCVYRESHEKREVCRWFGERIMEAPKRRWKSEWKSFHKRTRMLNPSTHQPLSCLLRVFHQFIFSSSQATLRVVSFPSETFSDYVLALHHVGADGESFRQTARETQFELWTFRTLQSARSGVAYLISWNSNELCSLRLFLILTVHKIEKSKHNFSHRLSFKNDVFCSNLRELYLKTSQEPPGNGCNLWRLIKPAMQIVKSMTGKK